jgi:hypothetical protein
MTDHGVEHESAALGNPLSDSEIDGLTEMTMAAVAVGMPVPTASRRILATVLAQRTELSAANERAEKAEARLAKLDAGFDVHVAALALTQQNRRELDAVIQQHVEQVGIENCELRTRAEQAEADRNQARARLAELRTEWGYRFDGNCGEDGFDSERTARLIAAAGDRIVWRLVGEWRDAETADAVQDGRSGPVEPSEAGDGSFQGNTSASASQTPQEATE